MVDLTTERMMYLQDDTRNELKKLSEVQFSYKRPSRVQRNLSTEARQSIISVCGDRKSNGQVHHVRDVMKNGKIMNLWKKRATAMFFRVQWSIFKPLGGGEWQKVWARKWWSDASSFSTGNYVKNKIHESVTLRVDGN